MGGADEAGGYLEVGEGEEPAKKKKKKAAAN
jgi:hypothetical protein